MIDNTNNKTYWNEYVTYWENKVQEANDKDSDTKNKTVGDSILEKYIEKLKISEDDVCLDFGCGSCRLYPVFLQKYPTSKYIGIDIAEECLIHAEERYNGQIKRNKDLWEFDGINLPFEEDVFDKIICFGVFDACSQEKVLGELLRVLKPDGILLITGKNTNYYIDDDEAYLAEVNARKKNHPNSFTNVDAMVRQLADRKYKVLESYFFLRRGDFVENKYQTMIPEIFYEWALLIGKEEYSNDREFDVFSDNYSVTFRNRQSVYAQKY